MAFPCHRELVVGRVVRQVLRLERLQVEAPDVRRPSAAVPFPRAVGLRLRHVRDIAPVRRERGELAVGHRQLLGQSAFHAHQVELAEPLASRLPARRDQHARAVRMPAHDAVVHRVIREPDRISSERRDDVGVEVAVVAGAEGDVGAVGGEARKQLFAGRRREPRGHAAALRHHPDIACVDERDVRGRDVGIPEHARVDLRGGRRTQGERDGGRGRQAPERLDHGCWAMAGVPTRVWRRPSTATWP